jgi:hypothetical protein
VPQGRKNNTDINRILSGFTVTSRKDVCTGFDMSIKKLRHIEKNDEERRVAVAWAVGAIGSLFQNSINLKEYILLSFKQASSQWLYP